MGSKTKKIHAAGKFGAGYGTKARKSFNKIEAQQRKRQPSPFHPRAKAIRVAAGIWMCSKTKKVFAGPAYILKEQ